MDEYTEWDEKIEIMQKSTDTLYDNAFNAGFDRSQKQGFGERDDARFQIERAVSMLEEANVFGQLVGDLVIINNVITRLQAWIEAKGGPWFQRG